LNRSVAQLALAQALMMSVNSLMVTTAAIIGSHLTDNLALGVGWNFMFIGGTGPLSSSYRIEEVAKAQAFNDFVVFRLPRYLLCQRARCCTG
jgi:hypothetical protein